MKCKKILVSIIIFILSFNIIVYSSETFQSKRVVKDITELSLEKYRGRLAGDSGNTMAAEYVADFFKEMNLVPSGDQGTYFQKFDAYVPHLEGNCVLRVFNKDKSLIKEYKYGDEFKEITYGASIKGDALGEVQYIENIENYSSTDFKKILLIKNYANNEGSSTYSMDLKLAKSNVKAIIVPANRDFRFRSPYKTQLNYENGLIKLMARVDIFNELVKYAKEGCLIEVESPVVVKKVSIPNVIGRINGMDKSLPPIILSAHFDHVGFDADGTVYSGALDNASGTAFLMECVRLFKDKKLNRTIIFAAFNGEEEMLLGSKYFVENPPIPIEGAECINFDMVGSSKDIPLTILSSNYTRGFQGEISQIIRSREIKTNILNQDNSDHVWFCVNDIDAVTFIHDDTTKIHTPKDTISNISENKLNEVFTALEAYLASRDISLAPSEDKPFFILNKKSIFYTSIVILILILYTSSEKLKIVKKK